MLKCLVEICFQSSLIPLFIFVCEVSNLLIDLGPVNKSDSFDCLASSYWNIFLFMALTFITALETRSFVVGCASLFSRFSRGDRVRLWVAKRKYLVRLGPTRWHINTKPFIGAWLGVGMSLLASCVFLNFSQVLLPFQMTVLFACSPHRRTWCHLDYITWAVLVVSIGHIFLPIDQSWSKQQRPSFRHLWHFKSIGAYLC